MILFIKVTFFCCCVIITNNLDDNDNWFLVHQGDWQFDFEMKVLSLN